MRENKQNKTLSSDSNAETVSHTPHKVIKETAPQDPQERKKGGNPWGQDNLGFEILKIVILAVIVVTPIRVFIAQPFVVSSSTAPPFPSSRLASSVTSLPNAAT